MRALGGELLFANHPQGGAHLILRLRTAENGVNIQPPEDITV